MNAESCPCGSGSTLDSCCEPIIAGTKTAPTAEACLRSRYTAFVRGNVDYIVNSHHTTTRKEISRESIEAWSKNAEWHGLEVREVVGGEEGDSEAIITFCASYSEDGNRVSHVEAAQFLREAGAWRFVSAVTPPYRRAERKVGRNEPCPCGSGKKFKRCCAANS